MQEESRRLCMNWKTLELMREALQLVAVGTKMPDWVQTGFTEYLRRFSEIAPFELIRNPCGRTRQNARISNAFSTKRAAADAGQPPPVRIALLPRIFGQAVGYAAVSQ